MARLDLPDGASLTVIRGTEAVTAAESGLLSAVQMAFADSQSAVAGSATVTSPAPWSGSTVMRHSRFGSMPLASWCGLSTRRAPVTRPPVTANARSRMVGTETRKSRSAWAPDTGRMAGTRRPAWISLRFASGVGCSVIAGCVEIDRQAFGLFGIPSVPANMLLAMGSAPKRRGRC